MFNTIYLYAYVYIYSTLFSGVSVVQIEKSLFAWQVILVIV